MTLKDFLDGKRVFAFRCLAWCVAYINPYNDRKPDT